MNITHKQARALGIGHLIGPIGPTCRRAKRSGLLIPLRSADAHESGPWQFSLSELPGNFNEFAGRHWSVKNRVKNRTRCAVGVACFADGVPRATGRRRVSIALELPAGRTAPDHDNLLKTLWDALTACGAIVDDSPEWIEGGGYTIEIGEKVLTVVTLEKVGQL